MLPLFRPLVALILGILLSPFLDPQAVWLCLPLAVLLAFVKRWSFLLIFTLLGAGLRSLEPHVPPDPGDLAVRMIGRLTKAPEWRGLGVYLDVEVQGVDGRPYRGRARLTEFLDGTDLRSMFEALRLGSGDRLEILVKLHRPPVYRNPGVFDFRRHLERQQIYWTGTIRNPRLITVIERGWHWPDPVKRWVAGRLEQSFRADPEVRGLIMGMVLGRKYGIGAATERQFQAGGLYHLVVVSGFNLAVIAAVTFWIARHLPCKRHTRLILVLIATIGYAAIVEGQAPVIRATLMVGFLVIGRLLDRGQALGNSIAGTALILLLIDPRSLEDSSFQMTFGAVIAIAGIGLPLTTWILGRLTEALTRFDDVDRDGRLEPAIADWRVARRMWCELHGMPSWVATLPWRVAKTLVEIAMVSVCVELVFVVFMVESFHRLSPVSPLLNVPASLIASAVTPLGLLTIILPGPLAAAPAAVASTLLHGLMSLVDLALRIPGATMRVPSPPIGIWMAYGITVICVVWAIHRRRRVIFMAAGLMVLGLQGVIAVADFREAPPKDVRLTFIDVGQGDSTLIEFPDGRRMLIDGGGIAAGRFLNLRDESTFSIGENVVSPFLFYKGLRKLDTVVLTHAHNDHIDGLLDVIENFDVGELWLGRNPMVRPYRELLRRAMERQIPIRWLTSQAALGDITVLHPPAAWRNKRTAENDDSVVLLLKTGKATALLTGDIERNIPIPNEVNVYKIPHHGSRGAKLRVPSPIRVISVGASNPFGHPHPSTLPALRTDRMGAITVTLTRPPVVVTN